MTGMVLIGPCEGQKQRVASGGAAQGHRRLDYVSAPVAGGGKHRETGRLTEVIGLARWGEHPNLLVTRTRSGCSPWCCLMVVIRCRF